MKSLLILRHAKAEAAGVGELDFDRDLARRGKDDAKDVGRFLAARKLLPDVIVASSARRTRKTASKVANAAEFRDEVIHTDDLYDAGLHEIVEVVRSLPKKAQLAMLVGHNPGMGDFVYSFAAPIAEFPTAALALIHFRIDEWHEFDRNVRGELVFLRVPSDEASLGQ